MVRGSLADLTRALRQGLSLVLCGSCESQLYVDDCMPFQPTLNLHVVLAHCSRREQSAASRIVVCGGRNVAKCPCPGLRASLRPWNTRNWLEELFSIARSSWRGVARRLTRRAFSLPSMFAAIFGANSVAEVDASGGGRVVVRVKRNRAHAMSLTGAKQCP